MEILKKTLCDKHAGEAMADVLKMVREAFATLTWNKENLGPDSPAGTVAFIGIKPPGHRVVVVEFSIEDQGFPPGSKGYDGTAVVPGGIVHLTREIAEEGFKIAAKQYEKSHG